MSSPPLCNGARVVRSAVFCVVFCRSWFCSNTFNHYLVCTSLIYDLLLPFWNPQKYPTSKANSFLTILSIKLRCSPSKTIALTNLPLENIYFLTVNQYDN